MEFKDLKDIDLKLNLLSGSIINVGNIAIKPYTLKEIKDYGYHKYIENIQWLSLTLDDFINSVMDDDKKDILSSQKLNLKTFDFYSRLGGVEYTIKLIESLSMIFRTKDITMLNKGILALNFYKMGILYDNEYGESITDKEFLSYYKDNELTVIHRENFDNIVEVVKLQNYLSQPRQKEDLEENPADEATRKLMEEMKRNREKVEAKKKAQQYSDDKGGEIDIVDIISAVSSKSNSINKINIWDLTLYQLYDEYSRLELIDNYDFSVKAIMAGAEKIDLKHWSSKL